jgi:hypothetical protein
MYMQEHDIIMYKLNAKEDIFLLKFGGENVHYN